MVILCLSVRYVGAAEDGARLGDLELWHDDEEVGVADSQAGIPRANREVETNLFPGL